MASTIVVRVECPPEVSRDDFVATTRAWLDHQCIMGDCNSDALGRDERVIAVEFDNPRDAHLFTRRFGAEPLSPRTRPGDDRKDKRPFLRSRVKPYDQAKTRLWAAVEAPAR